MQKYKQFIFSCFFATNTVATIFPFNNSAVAQVGISPIVIESQASRGQSESVINLFNPSKVPIRVRIFSQPFTYSKDGQFQTLSSSKQDLSSYLQFSPRELSLEPGESRKVRLLAQLDPNLPDGEYRAVVFAESLIENTNNQGSGIGVIARVATTVYVTKGNQVPNLTVGDASFNPKQNQLRLLVLNLGTATARPVVSWQLKQGTTVVRKGTIQPSTVIASSERNLMIELGATDTQPLPSGNYELIGELTWMHLAQPKTTTFKLPVNITQPISQSVGVQK